MQEESIEYVAATIHGMMEGPGGPRRLYLISTYVIGKERVLLEVRTTPCIRTRHEPSDPVWQFFGPVLGPCGLLRANPLTCSSLPKLTRSCILQRPG